MNILQKNYKLEMTVRSNMPSKLMSRCAFLNDHSHFYAEYKQFRSEPIPEVISMM